MTGIGVIGCGMVSHAYLGTIARTPGLDLVVLASRSMHSAEAQAARYGGTAMSVEALLADPAVAVVVNLAPPAVHHALGRRVLEAGKNLYSEKPFATTQADAADLIALAAARGLSIGCAPDTFLGEGHQTARRLIDGGAIGQVIGGSIAFGTAGMESWHPDPAFFYQPGGGPLLDIGPYYVTQAVNLLGPVAEVVAIGTMPRASRTVTTPGREGQTIDVAVPTSVTGALLFESGANVSIAFSWDVQAHRRPPIELYGDAGTMQAPDPNQFGGVVRVTRDGETWAEHGTAAPARKLSPAILAQSVADLMRGIDPRTGGPIDASTILHLGDQRGIGLIDLVEGLVEHRPARAGGALAAHVLDVLLALEASAAGQGRIKITSRVPRPAPMKASR